MSLLLGEQVKIKRYSVIIISVIIVHISHSKNVPTTHALYALSKPYKIGDSYDINELKEE